MLEYRQGEQETHLTPTDPSMDHGNTLQHSDDHQVSGQVQASRPHLCLRSSMQPRVTALSRNYICPSFLHQGLTSLKHKQRPAAGLIPRSRWLEVTSGSKSCVQVMVTLPEANQVPATSISSVSLPGILRAPC